ncbi:MAG: GDP-mannose 4,6-dehydratase [Anaerolineae bacterium]|nr:GDP-mannose 4,6-dehydratase [Anaerolineae bacterium]
MRALVTGGAGFIGSHLVDALLARGWQVVALDNLFTGRRSNVAHLADECRFRFVEGDVCDACLVEELTRGCDVVFHLAAVVGVTHVIANPLAAMRTNVLGTENVLAAAYRHGVRVCVASSSEVYGQSEQVPFVEDGPRVLGPTWIPRWSYATAKALDEHLCFAYRGQGLEVSVVRYFNAYGPRTDPQGYGSVVARFVNQALSGEPLTVLGDGQQTRSFTYVSDSVEGTILAGTMPAALGEVLNLGSEEEITIERLALEVIALTGSRSRLTYLPYEAAYGADFAEPRRRAPDGSKARRLIGFEPRVSLRDGLRRTIEWFRG